MAFFMTFSVLQRTQFFFKLDNNPKTQRICIFGAFFSVLLEHDLQFGFLSVSDVAKNIWTHEISAILNFNFQYQIFSYKSKALQKSSKMAEKGRVAEKISSFNFIKKSIRFFGSVTSAIEATFMVFSCAVQLKFQEGVFPETLKMHGFS